MKIIRLKSENVKRLSAVEIEPTGSLVTIAGKNGAGKSSVLDSIAYALGGQQLVPTEPIRKGETEAKITVDLGDLIVTRRFYREPIDAATTSDPTARIYGETKSALVVTNQEGARYPSPQAVLDKLLGKLTFDPLAFAHATGREQRNTLQRLVPGLDTSKFDEQRKLAADRRTMLKRTLDIKTAQLATLKQYPELQGANVVSITGLTKELEAAEEQQRVADEKKAAVRSVEQAMASVESTLSVKRSLIEELKRRLEDEETAVGLLEAQYVARGAELKFAKEAVRDALKAVPNRQEITERIKHGEIINDKIRANVLFNDKNQELEQLKSELATEVKKIHEAEEAKQKTLHETKYPVDGLGLTDDGVTFNDIPFEQASTSEQIRVSVAIGLALNPELKVLLIRNGNALDDDSIQRLAEQAEAAGAQVWLEYVTSSDEGVQVMIEDGHVATVNT